MKIGDFARLGQVSVRMLRHCDAMGLLQPAHVDGCSGCRSYDPEQLHVLNRLGGPERPRLHSRPGA